MDEDEIMLGELWEQLEERIDYEAADEYHNLSHEERVFMLVFWYQLDSENGGTDQFIWNTGGDHYDETIAALEEIGADRTAGYLRRIAAGFEKESGARFATDHKERREQIERFGREKLESLCEEEFKRLSSFSRPNRSICSRR